MRISCKRASFGLFLLASWASSARAGCLVSADPDTLVTAIADEVGNGPGISTGLLRATLPCPGADVKAAGLIPLLEASFTADQIRILRSTFVFQAPTLRESVAIAQTNASRLIREQVLGSYPKIEITGAALRDLPASGLSDEQIQLIAEHITLKASEMDFASAMKLALSDPRSRLFRMSFRPLTLASVDGVRSLFHASNHAQLAGKVYISDPVLWAFAVRNGASVADLSKFVSVEDRQMGDVFLAFQKAEIPDEIAAVMVTSSPEKMRLRERDVKFLSLGAIPSALVNEIFLWLQHEPIQVDPVTAERLKRNGVSDTAIGSLSRGGVYWTDRGKSAPMFVRKTEPDFVQGARQGDYQVTASSLQ